MVEKGLEAMCDMSIILQKINNDSNIIKKNINTLTEQINNLTISKKKSVKKKSSKKKNVKKKSSRKKNSKRKK